MGITTFNLRVEAEDGSGAEEYRVQDGDIEVRWTPQALDNFHRDEQWRRLNASEIASHVHGNTAVAQWLRHRIGWRRLLLACTEQETLEMFGVSKTPVDRHAA